MLSLKVKSFAKATTKLGLATTVAALWMAAVPFAAAAAASPPGYPISAARAMALNSRVSFCGTGSLVARRCARYAVAT